MPCLSKIENEKWKCYFHMVCFTVVGNEYIEYIFNSHRM
jgi:hypothetical protein